MRCHPPLHEFADLNHLAQGDLEKVLRCKKFLISYLGEVHLIQILFTLYFCRGLTLSVVYVLNIVFNIFARRYEA